MLQWLDNHSGSIGLFVAALPIAWAAVQFIFAKRRESKRVRFETYHSLIKQLVDPGGSEAGMFLDRHVAVVYELKEFKHYYPVTLRILTGLKGSWVESSLNSSDGLQRLLHEIDLTLEHISPKV